MLSMRLGSESWRLRARGGGLGVWAQRRARPGLLGFCAALQEPQPSCACMDEPPIPVPLMRALGALWT